MTAVDVPLTIHTALTSWRADLPSVLIPSVVFVGYLLIWRRTSIPVSRVVLFGAGCALWLYTGCGFIGVYGDILFWVRALQFVLLLMVAPFFLALGTPVAVLRDYLRGRRREQAARLFHSTAARVLTHPMTTSVALLAVPWLIYLTAWYPALLRHSAIDACTRILFVCIGFGYFYARLQVDPVPRRYPQVASLVITLVETLGDGVLGVVIWQGGLLAASYYEGLHRIWGPSIRTDQTIGAGVFWILGDVVGLPFLMVLLTRFHADERGREAEVDRVADLESARAPADEDAADNGLWWQNDPRFGDRYR